METTASIIVIASAILLAILVLVVIRVVFCKRVNRIAQYIFKELGNVEKVFAQDWGLAELNNGSIDDARAYYSAICKTDNGVSSTCNNINQRLI
jgi:hypothetical protein